MTIEFCLPNPSMYTGIITDFASLMNGSSATTLVPLCDSDAMIATGLFIARGSCFNIGSPI